VLNSLILIKSDVKSRLAGAGFEPAAYGFEAHQSGKTGIAEGLKELNYIRWLSPFPFFWIIREYQGNEGVFLVKC